MNQWTVFRGGSVWIWGANANSNSRDSEPVCTKPVRELNIMGGFKQCDILVDALGVITWVTEKSGDIFPQIQDIDNCVVHDLTGSFVLPGLTDAHLHADLLHSASAFIDLRHLMSTQAVLSRLEHSTNRLNGWLVGYGFEFEELYQPIVASGTLKNTKESLNRVILDKAFPQTPVFLTSACFHQALINSAGLQRCGILAGCPKSTARLIVPNPLRRQIQPFIDRGFIHTSTETADGPCLTGYFSDAAIIQLVYSHIFQGRGVEKTLRHLSTLGLTSVHTCDMGIGAVYKELSLSASLPLRVFHTPWLEDVFRCGHSLERSGVCCHSDRWEGRVRQLVNLLESDTTTGKSQEASAALEAIHQELNCMKKEPSPASRLIVNRMKVFADGTLGGGSAAVTEDGANVDSTRKLCWTDEELYQRLKLIQLCGLRPEIHVIGDAALLQALRIINSVSVRDWKPVLTHCCIAPKAARQLAAQNKAIFNIQPSFLPLDDHLLRSKIPTSLQQDTFCWRTLLQSEYIVCAGGSDAPVCPPDPFIGMYDAMFRPDTPRIQRTQQPILSCEASLAQCTWYPEERLTFAEALHLYTRGAAEAGNVAQSHNQERAKRCLKLGDIAPGFTADFTLVDRDVSVTPWESLLRARVIGTVIAGDYVFNNNVDK